MKVEFYSKDRFASAARGAYTLLPFRFMRWPDGDVLLTNDAGEYLFLDAGTFTALHQQRLSPDSNVYKDLKAKHFLADADVRLSLDLLATKFRTKKAFLEGFLKLHLFVVTLRCDHSCPYCQVSRVTEDKTRFDMSRETAARAIDLMFQSPSRALKVEFQGGEALLNFDLVRWCVEQIAERNVVEQRDIAFVIATNLAPLTDEMLDFCEAHRINLSTSLDGPAGLHNGNRPRPGGNSHALVLENLARARQRLGHDAVSALMTTTWETLRQPREVVDEYVRQDFRSVFLRSISPYGFAVRGRQARAYETERFFEFYRTALEYIIELNRTGTPVTETFSQILLQKILTPFGTGYVDLQSPAGAGVSVVAYNYDGNVFASDEARMLAEMNDRTFCLGNVHQHSFAQLFGGDIAHGLLESSCAETLPGCSDCAFVPYCGADPVFHWATQGDPVGHRPTSAFCQKHMAVFRHLFDLLKNGDEFTRRLLVSWATGVSLPEAA
jgi:His-Xaa-Ser system radical SAM maturase HxsB